MQLGSPVSTVITETYSLQIREENEILRDGFNVANTYNE